MVVHHTAVGLTARGYGHIISVKELTHLLVGAYE
jgi:hypothetical protein